MYKTFVQYFPSRIFWLANLLIWLLLNTLAATNSYRVRLHYEQPADWAQLWLEFIPWWGNWIFIAPIIIASTRLISFDSNKLPVFILKTIVAMAVIIAAYWGLTIIEVALIKHGTVNGEILYAACAELLLSPLHMDLLVYFSVLFGGYAYTYYNSSKLAAKRNQELSEQLLQVELQSLKSQLNPHFLFNTLNTIASLIRLDNKPHAIKALSELSFMLRKVLENKGNQLVSVEKEIEFIQSYLTIQQMRFEDKLVTSVQVKDQCLAYEIPFMLLQPLVENAVQHGSQLESNKNELKLNVYCDAGYLHVKLFNKVPEKDEHSGFGIGLSNCKERLAKLYQNNFELTLTPKEDGYFETYLCLPIGVLDA